MDSNMVYKRSFAEARESGELEQFHKSNQLNGDCAKAIDREISACRYNGDHYDAATAAKNAIAEYGAERVSWLLAGVIQNQSYDGRYSRSNKEWAQAFSIPSEGTRVYLQSHPVLVDYFTDKAREQIAVLDRQTVGRIADYIVWDGSQNTIEGNWITPFDSFPPELASADFIAAHQDDILRLLEQNTDVVADVEIINGSFDVCYCLAYCPHAQIYEGDEQPAPDVVHGYHVEESVLFPNNRGFALAENPNAVQQFVTWQFTEENGARDYYWGHYTTNRDKALDDFYSRSDEYKRDHSPVEKIRQRKEQKPSILAQLQEGKKAAVKSEDTPKSAPRRDTERDV